MKVKGPGVQGQNRCNGNNNKVPVHGKRWKVGRDLGRISSSNTYAGAGLDHHLFCNRKTPGQRGVGGNAPKQ